MAGCQAPRMTIERQLELSDIHPPARSAAAPTDAERVGPKAANLAALGACRPADAGRLLPDARMPIGRRSRHLGLDAHGRAIYDAADSRRAAPAVGRDQARRSTSSRSRRRFSSRCWPPGARSATPAAGSGAVRSSALIEDRKGANFAGQFESFLGIDRRSGIPHRRARLLGGAVDHECAPLHGEPRPLARRHGDGAC